MATARKAAKPQARYFEQTFLKPGRYHVGEGRFADVTAADIKTHVDETRRLIKAGYAPPVLLAHAKPGSKAGAPVLQSAAERVKNGVGWLDGVRVGDDGAAVHVLRITSPLVAEKIDEGSIAFASPELRPNWTDGKGRQWENIISHMALTHKPRSPDQGKFSEILPVPMAEVGVAQYSLDDMVALGDDDEDGDEDEDQDFDEDDGGSDTADDDDAAEDFGNGSESSETEDEDEGPDMPEVGDASSLKLQERLRAVIAHLGKMGVVLPEDTVEADTNVMLDRLLTGLLTHNAATDMAEADAADEDEDPDSEDGSGEKPEVIEQRGIGQFSCDALERAPKLVRKVIKHERSNLTRRLNKLVANSQMTPAGRAILLGHKSAMQFSADGSFLPLLSIPQFVSLIEKTIAPGAVIHADGLDRQFSVEDHFDGPKHRKRDQAVVTPEEAKAFVDNQAKELRGVFASR